MDCHSGFLLRLKLPARTGTVKPKNDSPPPMDIDAFSSILLSMKLHSIAKEVRLMLNVGDQAPDFTVMAHDGKPVTLSSLRGSKVLLWFYPKADTPG